MTVLILSRLIMPQWQYFDFSLYYLNVAWIHYSNNHLKTQVMGYNLKDSKSVYMSRHVCRLVDNTHGQSLVARPYSAPREGVWDMAIEQVVTQNLISHVNPVMMSWWQSPKYSKTCDLSAPAINRFLLCSSSWLKTLLAQLTSHASSSLSTQTEILNFPR